MVKVFRVMAAVIGIAAAGVFGEIANGEEETLKWGISDDGTLTIICQGAYMPNYVTRYDTLSGHDGYIWSPAPWYSYKNSIKKALISDDVANTGWNAFRDLPELTSVVIPNSVNSISNQSFMKVQS